MAQLLNCNVCTESKVVPEKSCPACTVPICENCNLEYIMSQNDFPHCMQCKIEWNRKSLLEMFGNVNLNKNIKAHIEDVLYDKEKSTLPAFTIEYQKNKSDLISKALNDFKRVNDKYNNKLDKIKNGIEKMTIVTLNEVQEKNMNLFAETIEFHSTKVFEVCQKEEKGEEKKVSIYCSCPVNDCRGFISNGWICLICQAKICKDCREVKDSDIHSCDPNTIKNVALIKKDTKNCPECKSPIFKIEGCNQMWCTSCNTAFDWLTLNKISTRVIHNPHYFEWMRRSGQDVRTNSDPCSRINRLNAMEERLNVYIYALLENLDLIQGNEYTPKWLTPKNTNKFKARYIDNEIDEKTFKSNLQRIYKHNNKIQEWKQVIGTLIDVSINVLEEFLEKNKKEIEIEKEGEQEVVELSPRQGRTRRSRRMAREVDPSVIYQKGKKICSRYELKEFPLKELENKLNEIKIYCQEQFSEISTIYVNKKEPFIKKNLRVVVTKDNDKQVIVRYNRRNHRRVYY